MSRKASIAVIALLAMVMVSATGAQEGVVGYWLFVEGAWKAGFKGQTECDAAGKNTGKSFECRALGPPKATGSANGEDRRGQAVEGPSIADCRARMMAWLATQPRGSKGTKYDVAKGVDCDTDAVVQHDLKVLEGAKTKR